MSELAHEPEVGTGELRSICPAASSPRPRYRVADRRRHRLGDHGQPSCRPATSGCSCSRTRRPRRSAPRSRLILIFGAVSGAHFNPVVTLVERADGKLEPRSRACTSSPRSIGGCLGDSRRQPHVRAAGRSSRSTKDRIGVGALWLSEVVATVGLLLVIHGASALRPRRCRRRSRSGCGSAAPTSSRPRRGFANPAVTIGRTLSDTFAGIAPASAPMFIADAAPRRRPRRARHPLPVPRHRHRSLDGGPRRSTVEELEGLARRRRAHRAVPVRAQRRPLADGRRLVQHLAGDRPSAWSGGSDPGREVNPAAIAAMAEVGIDIAGEYPKPWTDEIVRAADVIVTMGCGDACPIFPGQALRGLGARRPRRPRRRRRPPDPRRDPPPRRDPHRQPPARTRLRAAPAGPHRRPVLDASADATPAWRRG